jgi:hypothetical protein
MGDIVEGEAPLRVLETADENVGGGKQHEGDGEKDEGEDSYPGFCAVWARAPA